MPRIAAQHAEVTQHWDAILQPLLLLSVATLCNPFCTPLLDTVCTLQLLVASKLGRFVETYRRISSTL